MNFLIFRPSMSGGARVIARYARMMQERGHEITVTGLGAPPRKFAKKLQQMLGLAPRWRETPSHYRLEGLDLKLVDNKKALTADDLPDADVVVASFWITAEWMATLPPEKGAKVYFAQHHEAEFPHANRERAAATYRTDCKILAVSGWLIDVLNEKYGRDDATLILNAVDTKLFAPRAPRRKQSRPTIGFLGSGNKTKRVDISVRTCEILRERFPDLRVRVLAATPPRGAYVMHDWFEPTYNPPQEALADFYADCDAWLFTSDIEGYGLPLLEALACGTPLVARPAGAAPDLVTTENGVLVDSDDPALIADAAARILSSSDDAWKKMSNAALAAASTHDWDASYAKFEAALFAAAKSAGKSSG
ncbi:MAG: glycosyltransferase family 4 protein [Parvularculaceae bacterium]